MVLAAGTRLGPYEVVAPLGAGGMGEVYRARDPRIGRDVALKVLPASVAGDPSRLQRFEQEARAAGQLNHPNVLVLHDVGAHEGAPYLVTELLEGETLRDLLSRERLSWQKAAEISVQVARGLAAAHERGIVHRDLKPENLFLTRDGRVKILDFGLAKLRPTLDDEALERQTVSQITGAGTVLGTVGYMAPEQVKGQRADARSDIFSLGCVLYEMIAGRRAFRAATTAETMSAILKDDPPPLGGAGSTAPPALEPVVRHCLEKRPERRFQSARDLAFALETLSDARGPDAAPAVAGRAPARTWMLWAAAAGVAALVVWAAVFAGRRGDAPAPAAAGVKLLAVLPFENLGGPEDEYFADGMTDEVRGKLAGLPGLQVIARTSSNQYKKTTKTTPQIASELGVQYLLTATVRWERGKDGGSRVRVSPELVEAATVTTKWQQPFDAVLSDVFQVQTSIAGQVARALDLALGQGDRKRLEERPTANLAAYEAYLLGNEAAGGFLTDRVDVRRAIDHYERAVALDPGFALAWAHLSRAHSYIVLFGAPSPAGRERAKAAADRALALAPGLPAAHLAKGMYYRIFGDGSKELEQYALGLRRAPQDTDLLASSAFALQSAGRWDEALASLRQAQALDPRSAGTAMTLSHHLMLRRRYAEALEAADRGLALAPQSLAMIVPKVAVFVAQGDLSEARGVINAATREVAPTALLAHVATYGDLFWVLDDEQQELLLRLTPEPFDDDRVSWGLALAQTASLRGDSAKTREYAEAARAAAAAQVLDMPGDGLRHVLLGLALAYLGRNAEAVREGERAVALLPVAKDAVGGPYLQHQLARIYLRAGEPDKALDLLEPLLQVPGELSPGRLRIDPEFAPLKDHPRFRRMAAGT